MWMLYFYFFFVMLLHVHVDSVCYGKAKKRKVCNVKNVYRCNLQMHDCEIVNAWNIREEDSARQGYNLGSLVVLLEVASVDRF